MSKNKLFFNQKMVSQFLVVRPPHLSCPRHRHISAHLAPWAVYSSFFVLIRVLEAMPSLQPGSASASSPSPLTDGSGCTLSATSVGSGSHSRSASTSSPWSVWSLPASGPTACCAGVSVWAADNSGVPASPRQPSSSSSRAWCRASSSPRTRSSISEH